MSKQKAQSYAICKEKGRLAAMVIEYMYLPLIRPQSEVTMHVFDLAIRVNTDVKTGVFDKTGELRLCMSIERSYLVTWTT